MIRVDSIEVNPGQPRVDFDETALNELAQSIKTYGLIQPITVRPIANGRYQIISGERRWRA
ncbi:MAG: ParB/RepB/Spo0J family partition protein, partial [Bacteroidales bacterium]|nr:ParB/RepB/Spo0J family partition protein [Bacteroidales bacterium]